jgi:Acetyltransferases
MLEVTSNRRKYIPLLLLGDEQEELVLAYIDKGDLFALSDEDGQTLAVALVLPHPQGVELKNLAVTPERHGQGLGSALLTQLFARYAGQWMFAGTGDVPSALGFYRKNGFLDSHRIPNFFLDHYDHVIVEDGIQLVDMVYLKRMC